MTAKKDQNTNRRRRANDDSHDARIHALEQELAVVRIERDTLRQIAYRDALTGLGNRRFLDLRLADEAERAAAATGYVFSLALVDVDGLKAINDAHGHAAGDRLLRDAAAYLGGAIRGRDACARLGGDEMVLVFAGANALGSATAIARIIAGLCHTEAPDGAPISLSVGVATWGVDGTSAESLLESADRAMYRDKRRRNVGRRA